MSRKIISGPKPRSLRPRDVWVKKTSGGKFPAGKALIIGESWRAPSTSKFRPWAFPNNWRYLGRAEPLDSPATPVAVPDPTGEQVTPVVQSSVAVPDVPNPPQPWGISRPLPDGFRRDVNGYWTYTPRDEALVAEVRAATRRSDP